MADSTIVRGWGNVIQMRRIAYTLALKLPFKIGSVLLALAGIVSSYKPAWVQSVLGGEIVTIQNVGPILLSIAVVYFALLWLLKPGEKDGDSVPAVPGPGPTFNIGTANFYGNRAAEEVASISPQPEIHTNATVAAPLPSVTVAPPLFVNTNTFFSPTVTQSPPGQLADVTLEATGALFPLGLYVGTIVVSTVNLEESGFIEIAARAFNGTDRTLRVAGVEGNAFVQELEDIKLRTPKFTPDNQSLLPLAEFVVALRQPIPKKLIAPIRARFDVGEAVTLDLRKLNIITQVEEQPENRGRLPLWDGIRLWPREEIFTGRVIMASLEPGSFRLKGGDAKMTVARKDGSEEKGQ